MRGTFEAVGKDGVNRTFTYEMEPYNDYGAGVTKDAYTIKEPGSPAIDDFDLKVAVVGNTVKVTDMNLDEEQFYKGKGIPESMILELKKLYPDKKITSSSNKAKTFPNEYRTVAADAVWGRLVRKGLASYDEGLGVFVVS